MTFTVELWRGDACLVLSSQPTPPKVVTIAHDLDGVVGLMIDDWPVYWIAAGQRMRLEVQEDRAADVEPPGAQANPPRRADCPAASSSGYCGHVETEPSLRAVSEDDRVVRSRKDMPRVHPEAHRGNEPRDPATPERGQETG